jgi:hypothetical protein
VHLNDLAASLFLYDKSILRLPRLHFLNFLSDIFPGFERREFFTPALPQRRGKNQWVRKSHRKGASN